MSYLQNNLLSHIRVDLDRVLDLTDPGWLALTREHLTRAETSVCQELGAAALSRGFQGLLVPSVVPHFVNLVILSSNLPEPVPLRVVGSVHLPLEVIRGEEPG